MDIAVASASEVLPNLITRIRRFGTVHIKRGDIPHDFLMVDPYGGKMGVFVAIGAQGNQIPLKVCSQCTPRTDMVYLEINPFPTILTLPTISFEDDLAKRLVSGWIEPKPATVPSWVHDAFLKPSTNMPFCMAGSSSNRRKRAVSIRSESPVSTPTPARKSAQIISRQ